MSRLTLLTVLLVAAIFLGEGECKGKNKEKHKQCMKQTMDLQACCPFPKDEEMMNGPCKEHLDGIDEKEDKEKFRAYSCFSDCSFKSNGLVNEAGELQYDKIKEATFKLLDANNGADFKAISDETIDYCAVEIAAMKAKWEKKMEEKNKDGKNKDENKDKDGGPKCNFLPSAISMCFIGNVVRNCPATKWQANPECEAIKLNTTSMEDCMKD